MPRQPVIPAPRHAAEHRAARREKFLAKMGAVVPWNRLLAPVEPHYPKAKPKGGRSPMPLETMLRAYFLQNRHAPGDPMAEESLLDGEATRRFAGIGSGDDRVPGETAIPGFRRLPETRQPSERLFAEVGARLAGKGTAPRGGTPADAPSSAKNDAGARDPGMSPARKGGQWLSGTGAQADVDCASGIARGLDTTAKVRDGQVRDGPLHGGEKCVFADRVHADSDGGTASEENGGSSQGAARKAPQGAAGWIRRTSPPTRPSRRRAPVRPRGDPPTPSREEPGASLRAIRPRQPLPRVTKVGSMTRSPPGIGPNGPNGRPGGREGVDFARKAPSGAPDRARVDPEAELRRSRRP